MAFPNKSGKATVVILAGPKKPSMNDPDDDAPNVSDSDSVDLESGNGDAPTAYAGNLQNVPDFLTTGYEGSGVFKFKVTDRTDNPDGTTSLELELHSMEPNGGGKTPPPPDTSGAMNDAWDAAENGGDAQ